MTDRTEIDRLLRGLYDARVSGNLEAVCQAFASDAVFQIAGAGQTSPVSNSAIGAGEFRPLLALMIRAFKLSDHIIFSILIDGSQAAVHWSAKVYSRITGNTVLTELVDLIKIRDGRIISYTEFFVPRS